MKAWMDLLFQSKSINYIKIPSGVLVCSHNRMPFVPTFSLALKITLNIPSQIPLKIFKILKMWVKILKMWMKMSSMLFLWILMRKLLRRILWNNVREGSKMKMKKGLTLHNRCWEYRYKGRRCQDSKLRVGRSKRWSCNHRGLRWLTGKASLCLKLTIFLKGSPSAKYSFNITHNWWAKDSLKKMLWNISTSTQNKKERILNVRLFLVVLRKIQRNLNS